MKITACAVVAAVLLLGTGSALGQECGPLNIIFKPDTPSIMPGDPLYDAYVPMVAAHFEIPLADFQWCWTQRVVGTIQGTWVACGGGDLIDFGPFGLHQEPWLLANPGILITSDGEIFTLSYGLAIYDETGGLAFGGITRYGGGTGAYVGASGYSTDSPMHYPPTNWIRSVGLLCSAD